MKPYRKIHDRNKHLKRRYGLTSNDYELLLLKAKGVCEICGRAEIEVSQRNQRLNIDHNHQSGHVRGLLCSVCNRALGFMDDSADRLRKAIAYLERGK